MRGILIDKSAKDMTAVDSIELVTHLDQYDLCSIVMAVLFSPVIRTMRPNCESKSTFLSNTLSPYTKTGSQFSSNSEYCMDVLFS